MKTPLISEPTGGQNQPALFFFALFYAILKLRLFTDFG